MDQSNRRVELKDTDLAEVRKIFRADGMLNDVEIARRSWSVYEIDDKSIFDEDARHLASAFQGQSANSFYVIRVCDLLTSASPVAAYRVGATQDELEAFQSPSWFEINLDDCLMFNLPVTCAVLRPGDVDTTRFVGSSAFIAKIMQV
jgi:hypothetical protein